MANHEDCISRKDTLNSLKECLKALEDSAEDAYDFGEIEGLKTAIECVKEMSSVHEESIKK